MKVLIMTGSAHKKGTTAILTENFIKGAIEAGHDVYRFDCAFKTIHACIACERCHTDHSGCVFKDDMEELNEHLLDADVIVFVSPIYYYAMNAQIKVAIDRFYANDEQLHGHKKAILMVTMADDIVETADGAIAAFKGTLRYLQWENAGMVVGISCGNVDALNKTDYPKQAYELGRNLK